MAKPNRKKKKSKCVFLDFTEITSHHHKYAKKRSVRGAKRGVYHIISGFFAFPSFLQTNNNPYKYHIQINRREREFLHTTHPIVREKTVAATKNSWRSSIFFLHFE